MSAEINSMKSFFNSIQIHFSDIWLASCINWCKTEALPPNYTFKELQSQVYNQWLLLDLRDIEVPVLPPNLSTKQHYTLEGNFCLQMMQIVDIAKPKLWQLQKIRNSNALTRGTQQESEVVGTGKRMLQMTLTDGVQEIEAMEYHPVPCLSLNLHPGVKVRILGPVIVRRGRLMLEQQNVKILGGEVEELLVSNAAENVLARSLKLPENPNPGAIEEKLLVVEKEEKNEGYVAKVQLKPPVNKLTKEEEMLMAQEFNTAMETEHQQVSGIDPFEDPDFDPLDFRNISTNRISTQKQIQNELSVSLEDDNDIFDNIDIDAHLDEVDRQQEPNPVPKINIFTISKLNEIRDSVSKGVFRINAKFKSVEEKLRVVDGQYRLVIKVEDSTGDLVVRVHNDVVASFAGCTVAEIEDLKTYVFAKNQAATERMMQAIISVKEKLLKLDNILVLDIEKNQTPVITKVL